MSSGQYFGAVGQQNGRLVTKGTCLLTTSAHHSSGAEISILKWFFITVMDIFEMLLSLIKIALQEELSW